MSGFEFHEKVIQGNFDSEEQKGDAADRFCPG
jgi:hypothetical protein